MFHLYLLSIRISVLLVNSDFLSLHFSSLGEVMRRDLQVSPLKNKFFKESALLESIMFPSLLLDSSFLE